MFKRPLLLLAALGVVTAVTPAAEARPPDREQDAAYRGTQAGHFKRLRMIEARIVPQMRGFRYLGPELDVGSARYRLKFIRGSQIVWIDFDARTGQEIGRMGF